MPARTLNRNSDKNSILFVLIIILGLGVYFFLRDFNSKHQLYSYDVTKVTYVCPDNKTISAEYSGNIVNLNLSDGRNLVLNHSLADMDAKYTNKEGNFVFTKNGPLASISENNTLTYQNCTEQ